MADRKSWGKTVLGWFVVSDGSAGEETAAGAPESAGPALPQDAGDATAALARKYGVGGAGGPGPAAVDMPVKPQGPLPTLGDSDVDLEKVYDAFGVDADERDRVTRARELLRTLPQETPAPLKRQIVEASLRSFGVPTEKIIEAAAESLQALEMFNRQGQSEAQSVLTDGNARIESLEQEIAAIRKLMQDAVAAQGGRQAFVNQEKLRVQEVLEFFGQEAVAAVVQASPKLQSP